MYTLQFRKKIFAVKNRENLSFEAVGERFDVHPRTIQRWAVRIEPKLKREKPASKIDMKVLEQDVKENPDLYQWERAQKLGVTPNAVLYALRRLGITYKKNSRTSKSRRSTQNNISTKA